MAAILAVSLERRQTERGTPRAYSRSVPRGRKRKRSEDPLDPYRRVRKPVPPPGRVLPDRRREIQEENALREARRAEEEARGDEP